ncbi:MAG: membrane protein insertion efficiency factor YidD [Patescibacteria group bacterium]
MKKLILSLLKFYKKFLSPGNFGVKVCRFEPSCSVYSYIAIQKYGLLKGGYMGIVRLLRCNPFSKGGYDPVK